MTLEDLIDYFAPPGEIGERRLDCENSTRSDQSSQTSANNSVFPWRTQRSLSVDFTGE